MLFLLGVVVWSSQNVVLADFHLNSVAEVPLLQKYMSFAELSFNLWTYLDLSIYYFSVRYNLPVAACPMSFGPHLSSTIL